MAHFETSPRKDCAGEARARTVSLAWTVHERPARKDRVAPGAPATGPVRLAQGAFMNRLPGRRQRELAPPPGEERGTQRAVGGIRQLGVARNDPARLPARLLEQARVAQ